MLIQLLLTAAMTGAQPGDSGCAAPASAPRLDHVILAVRDLDSVSARFAGLGFRLKNGRPHPNGLLNRHIKFRDGTEIELMTVAGPATDRMAEEYVSLIAAGDGGAYAALRVTSMDAVETAAAGLGLGPRRSAAGSWQFLSFAPNSSPAAVFFVAGGLPAEDPDSILTHADSARSLREAWVEAGPELGRLLERLGGRVCPDSVRVAGRWGRRVALAGGAVVILPPAHAAGPPRVIGAVLSTTQPALRGRKPVPVLAGFWVSY